MMTLPGTTENQIVVSVCIATYKRNELLKNLLKSLEAQELAENISLEIIVVDNDESGRAKSVLDEFQNSDKVRFKYYLQPVKNISLTRNMGVQNAAGDFICFVDDDETATKDWIQNFYNTVSKYNADGAFGHVEAFFDESIPEYLQKREFYFSTIGETGTEAKVYFTTNTIVKSELIKNADGPFDPKYGLTGGEDVHLFEKLYKTGAKFVNCKGAITNEFIPKDRGTVKYIYKRALQGGQSFIRRRLENNNSLSFKSLLFSKAVINLLLSILRYPVGVFSSRNKIASIKNFGASIGKLRSLLGIHKDIY
jgi:glycosyltransferase involved in cell wall biosynthesis